MASAGRILIIPKGNYDSTKAYEMLDLVFHGGTSWLAKTEVTGIEPSEEHSEHWFKMCEATDLTEVENRLTALESQMLASISLDDIDLTPYAKKEAVDKVASDLSTLDTEVGGLASGLSALAETVNGMSSSGLKIASGSYTGTGYSGSSGKTSITFDFEPKVVFLQDSQFEFSCPVIWHKGVSVLTLGLNGSNTTKQLQFSLSGNTLSWYYPLQEPDTQLNNSGTLYHWVAIG